MFEKEISFSIPEKLAKSYVLDSETIQDFVDYLLRCHLDVISEYIDETMDLFREYLECGLEGI